MSAVVEAPRSDAAENRAPADATENEAPDENAQNVADRQVVLLADEVLLARLLCDCSLLNIYRASRMMTGT